MRETMDSGDRGFLTAEETRQLSDQIGSLSKAGLPLGPGLIALGEEFTEGRFRKSLLDLARSIDRGVPLEEALEQQRERIPAHLRGLVIGGLRSGQIGDILGRFSAYVAVGTELKRRLWLSLAYPIAAILVALSLFIFVNLILVGQFEAIFKDFGVPLPRLTVSLLVVSHAVRSGWPAIVGILLLTLVAWIGARLFLKTADRHSLAARIPVIGAVWRYTSWAELCHLMALLLETRLPMPEALRLAGEGVRNSSLDRACRDAATAVERGMRFSQALAEQPALPVGLSRLIRWSEDHNAIPDILHMAGEMFEARARSQATFSGTVMAVLAVLMVLWGVFTVVIGLMLPLVTLISKLSG
jgi:type II secretory pathway component PulF